MDELNRMSFDIIGAAFEVRKTCGKMLLESYYENALAYELRKLGYHVDQQVRLPAFYKDTEIKEAYIIDLVVNNKIIIELKSLNQLNGNEIKQLNTYLYLSKFKLGFLINFSAKDFTPGIWNNRHDKDKGIIRIIN